MALNARPSGRPRPLLVPQRSTPPATPATTLWTLIMEAYELLGQPSLFLAQDLLDASVQGALEALEEIHRMEGGPTRGRSR